jgi:hypothetical protein
LFITPGRKPGQLKGNFSARIRLDRPGQSSASGRLAIKDIVFPWDLKVPVRIRDGLLTGRGNRLTVENTEVICGEQRVNLYGDIGFSDQGIQLALNITGKGFDATPIVNALIQKPVAGRPEGDMQKTGEQAGSDGAARGYGEWPFSGTIGIDLERLTYDGFDWEPFRATVSPRPESIDVEVSETELCNISMPGKFIFTPDDISMHITAAAENKPLDQSLKCIRGPDYRATGTFDLKGNLRGRGAPADLPGAVEGELHFHARDGRIYKDFLLKNVLTFLSITEVFVGRLPDIGREGFAYYSIDSSVKLKDGKALLAESVMDGGPLDIAMEGEVDYLNQTVDLKGLVAPLKTIRRVIDLVPIVGKGLADAFTTVPFHATGSWKDPQVETAYMSSITPGLADMLKNLGEEATNSRKKAAAGKEREAGHQE